MLPSFCRTAEEKRKAEEAGKAPAAADEKDTKQAGGDAKTKPPAAPTGPGPREASFVVVGSAGGGKTSLLAQYIPSKEEMVPNWAPAPTTALEYRYARSLPTPTAYTKF
jgi:hypothetical protein